MKRFARSPRLWFAAVCAALGLAGAVLTLGRVGDGPGAGACAAIQQVPRIRPDYTDVTLPPNIAPLNFAVLEPGTRYQVTLSAARGEPLTVRSRSPEVIIPPKGWKRLLDANRGEELRCEVCVRDPDGTWRRFEAVRNRIAREDIDGYVVYRKIRPIYNFWVDIGVYQRNLATYDESTVLHNRQFPIDPKAGNPCLNCHSFCNSRTDRMAIAVRAGGYDNCTPVVVDGAVTKLGTKFGYTAWHPSGRIAAYSLNTVRQFFHAGGTEVRDVVDLDSDLVYYEIGSTKVKTSPAISDPDRLETYPAWSPDGRFLYYCSAPIPWSDRDAMPPERYEQVRYDLLRVPYDIETDAWGEPETVLAASETGLSVLLPRVSPDGKHVLLCMCEYGCFPIYQPTSDLYLLNVESGKYERLGINSDRSESWHSWSSNGRWFAFSSKRHDGLLTRLYLSYFDEAGKAHKPVLMPQRDPAFYNSCLKTYSVPELIAELVQVSANALSKAIRSSRGTAVKMPEVSMTRKAEPSVPWRPGIPKRQ